MQGAIEALKILLHVGIYILLHVVIDSIKSAGGLPAEGEGE